MTFSAGRRNHWHRKGLIVKAIEIVSKVAVLKELKCGNLNGRRKGKNSRCLFYAYLSFEMQARSLNSPIGMKGCCLLFLTSLSVSVSFSASVINSALNFCASERDISSFLWTVFFSWTIVRFGLFHSPSRLKYTRIRQYRYDVTRLF